jgi:hypothetical protein
MGVSVAVGETGVGVTDGAVWASPRVTFSAKLTPTTAAQAVQRPNRGQDVAQDLLTCPKASRNRRERKPGARVLACVGTPFATLQTETRTDAV